MSLNSSLRNPLTTREGMPMRAEHHGHRGGEVFAVSLLAYEKKIGDGIAHRSARQFERVTEARAEIAFDGGGLVEIVGG